MLLVRHQEIVKLFGVGVLVWWIWPTASLALESGIFRAFTDHISNQVTKDVYEFSEAQKCTEWFYKKLRKPPYVKPEVEKTTLRSIGDQDEKDHPCATLFPNGIEGARERFSYTQSTLSLSLTFYQFALLGDKNDDEEYDARELADVLESVGEVYRVNEPHLPRLTERFDAVRKAFQFEVLTDGMKQLFEKGYRLTEFDQGQMNRLTGGNHG